MYSAAAECMDGATAPWHATGEKSHVFRHSMPWHTVALTWHAAVECMDGANAPQRATVERKSHVFCCSRMYGWSDCAAACRGGEEIACILLQRNVWMERPRRGMPRWRGNCMYSAAAECMDGATMPRHAAVERKSHVFHCSRMYGWSDRAAACRGGEEIACILLQRNVWMERPRRGMPQWRGNRMYSTAAECMDGVTAPQHAVVERKSHVFRCSGLYG